MYLHLFKKKKQKLKNKHLHDAVFIGYIEQVSIQHGRHPQINARWYWRRHEKTPRTRQRAIILE